MGVRFVGGKTISVAWVEVAIRKNNENRNPSKIFVILPNGQSTPYQKRLFQDDLNTSLLPGSTIVVSRNPDPFNWLRLASVITPISSDLAVSAAAVAAISDNN